MRLNLNHQTVNMYWSRQRTAAIWDSIPVSVYTLLSIPDTAACHSDSHYEFLCFFFPIGYQGYFWNGYCEDIKSLRMLQFMCEGIVSQERTARTISARQTAAGENLVTRCNWAAEKVSGNEGSSLGRANRKVTYPKVWGRSGHWLAHRMWGILHSRKSVENVDMLLAVT